MLWQLQGALGDRYHEVLKEAADQYGTLYRHKSHVVAQLNNVIGPLVRIGPNELLSTDPDALRRMSSVRSLYTKGSFYESGRITPGVDNVVSIRDEDKHKDMRAKMWAAVSRIKFPMDIRD